MRYNRSALRAPLLVVLACLATSSVTWGQSLVYTPIPPCRVIDTRLAGGVLAPGVSRMFNVVGVGTAGSLASQGGNPAGCPIPGFDSDAQPQVQAIAINLVAVGAGGAGDLVAWASDSGQPVSSVLNYAIAGSPRLNIANAIILPVRQDTQGGDITLLAQSASTQVVADVLGFYSNTFLPNNTSGTRNTALGATALLGNTSGNNNTALGTAALFGNTTGTNNTGVGQVALFANQNGSNNTAIGDGALENLLGGGQNIAIGALAGSGYAGPESLNIAIFDPGQSGDLGTIRIGTNGVQSSAFIQGIFNATSSSGIPVLVNSVGQLGTSTSSIRFKEDIADMDETSDGLMKLRPVTFHYKAAHDDGSGLLQYGLIAEEVAQVYPDLVQYDPAGKPLAVRYHFINAMVLNEVQKQRTTIATQAARLAAQSSLLAAQQARLEEFAAQLAELKALVTNPR